MRTPRLSALLLLCSLPILPFQTTLAVPGPDDDRATPLVLPRLSGPITLDGHSDEAAWQAIEPLPLTMHKPVFEGAMTERTDLYLVNNDNLNTDRQSEEPEPDLPFSSTRAVLLKYSITFVR